MTKRKSYAKDKKSYDEQLKADLDRGLVTPLTLDSRTLLPEVNYKD